MGKLKGIEIPDQIKRIAQYGAGICMSSTAKIKPEASSLKWKSASREYKAQYTSGENTTVEQESYNKGTKIPQH